MGGINKSVKRGTQRGRMPREITSGRKAEPESRLANLNRKLFDAAERGDLQGIDNALDKGADVNARNATGHTPIMMAVMRRRDDAIELLISRKADVNAENDNGKSVLWFADAKQSRILRRAGAKAQPTREFSLCAGCPEPYA